MDEDWEEELAEAFAQLEAEWRVGVPQRRFRATIRGTQLQLVGVGAHLADDGPLATMFADLEETGVTIADLADSGDEREGYELTVTVLAAGAPTAEETILEWAALVGYRRVWLPGRVVTTAGRAPAVATKASVTCPGCGHVWTASGRSFWLSVLERRSFPMFCPLCGGDVPQWKLVARPSYVTDCPPLDRRRDGGSS